MSLHDYKESQRISAEDPPFYALVMACFRKADSYNLLKLRRAFPQVWAEFMARYDAPGGLLKGEQFSAPQEYPDTIMGMKVVVSESATESWGLVLGSFNDYDHSKEEEPDGVTHIGN